jgi:hypothetical protein
MAINQEIERYVREERSRGVPEESIRHALLAKGWEYPLVEMILEETRPGDFASLFTHTFFRFAFGFIMVISLAVSVILVIGTLTQREGGSPCIVDCNNSK